jgi:hypothetical protein
MVEPMSIVESQPDLSCSTAKSLQEYLERLLAHPDIQCYMLKDARCSDREDMDFADREGRAEKTLGDNFNPFQQRQSSERCWGERAGI